MNVIAIAPDLDTHIQRAIETAHAKAAERQRLDDALLRHMREQLLEQIPEWMHECVGGVYRDNTSYYVRIDLPRFSIRLTACSTTVVQHYLWHYWHRGSWQRAMSCEEAVAAAVEMGSEPYGDECF